MRHILTSVVLVVLLFPSFALGETVKFEDLVEREGLHYKKFTDIPFSGKTTGNTQGTFRHGKKHGPWVRYWDNGQLSQKGTYKDGKWDGPWVGYYDNGKMWSRGTYKDGKEEGPWVWYDRRSGRVVYRLGSVLFTGTYRNGRRVGD